MIPDNYKWLQSLQLPKLVTEALACFGTKEIPGDKSNELILEWAKEVNLQSAYRNDDVAWCGLFIAAMVKRSGRDPIANPLWARNWSKWGKAGTPAPMLGDILVFSRGIGGHVAVYVAEDNVSFHVLGGNQSNTVNIVRVARHRMIACRRPEYINQPDSVKRYELTASGKLSENES